MESLVLYALVAAVNLALIIMAWRSIKSALRSYIIRETERTLAECTADASLKEQAYELVCGKAASAGMYHLLVSALYMRRCAQTDENGLKSPQGHREET